MVTNLPWVENKMQLLREISSCEEIVCEDRSSDTLLIAHYLNGLLYSFDVETWNAPKLGCALYRLEDSGEMIETKIIINNVSKVAHYKEHGKLFIDARKDKISNKEDLWRDRDNIFRNLEFCQSFVNDLESVNENSPHFHQLVNKLFYLDDKFEKWTEGDVDLRGYRCSPVSEEALKKYSTCYTFKNQNGDEIIANWKLYITPGKHRLYFDVCHATKKGIICHFGEKLPDITYGFS